LKGGEIWGVGRSAVGGQTEDRQLMTDLSVA
jgi:hypothetical protein